MLRTTVLRVTATFAAGLLSASLASAATFDFAEMANGNESFWYANGDGTGTSSVGNAGGKVTSGEWTPGPVTNTIGVKAFGNTYTPGSGTPTTGTISPNPGNNYAYLDGYSGGKPGGLGVCASTRGPTSDAQCDPSSDDNAGLSFGSNLLEYVTLTFSESVGLTGLILRGDNHSVLGSGNKIGISQGTFDGTLMNFQVGTTNLFNLGASNIWTFAKISGGSNFYLDTVSVEARQQMQPIPIPASGLLLFGALGAMGVAARRRRKS